MRAIRLRSFSSSSMISTVFIDASKLWIANEAEK
jgi:hypothetical protein